MQADSLPSKPPGKTNSSLTAPFGCLFHYFSSWGQDSRDKANKKYNPLLQSVLLVFGVSVNIVRLTSDTQVRGPSHSGASMLWSQRRRHIRAKLSCLLGLERTPQDQQAHSPASNAENEMAGQLVPKSPQNQSPPPLSPSLLCMSLSGFSMSNLIHPCCSSNPIPLIIASMEMKVNHHLYSRYSNPGGEIKNKSHLGSVDSACLSTTTASCGPLQILATALLSSLGPGRESLEGQGAYVGSQPTG